MKNCILLKFLRGSIAWGIDLLVVSIPLFLWVIGVWSDVGGRYRVESWYQKYLWQEWLFWAWILAVFLYFFAANEVWGASLGKQLVKKIINLINKE